MEPSTLNHKIPIFLLLFLLSVVLYAQQEVQLPNGTKAVFEGQDGIFNGQYQSYYNNGQLCAKGAFDHNFRTGEWSVWSQEGQLLVRRVYTTPFVYTTTYPVPPSTPLIELLNVPQYIPSRNKAGFIEYHFIHERMVFFENRIWRFLPADQRNAWWMTTFLDLLHSNSTIKAYKTDNFEKKLTTKNNLKESQQLLGFKLKEVFFFDTDRFLTEQRILGLSPVVVDTITQDTTELFWVYYPQIREELARIVIKRSLFPVHLQTLDDLFFYRHFSSFIYREHNLFDNKNLVTPLLSKTALEKKSSITEIEQIELEHALWTTFSKKE